MLWAEGPAWNGVGRYLVWSDIPNNVQLGGSPKTIMSARFRILPISVMAIRLTSKDDRLSCEHATRRVVRYEHNGSVTVLADKWQGKPFNAPNDIVVHPDGGIWFTDPGYGSMGNYEGNKGELLDQGSRLSNRLENRSSSRWSLTNLSKPNGLCFSPDYKKIYVVDTGRPGGITMWDLVDGKKIQNKRPFASMSLKTLRGIEAVLTECEPMLMEIFGRVPVGPAKVSMACTSSHLKDNESVKFYCQKRPVTFVLADQNGIDFLLPQANLYTRST